MDLHGEAWVLMWTSIFTVPRAFYFPLRLPHRASEQQKLKADLRGKTEYMAARLLLFLTRLAMLYHQVNTALVSWIFPACYAVFEVILITWSRSWLKQASSATVLQQVGKTLKTPSDMYESTSALERQYQEESMRAKPSSQGKIFGGLSLGDDDDEQQPISTEPYHPFHIHTNKRYAQSPSSTTAFGHASFNQSIGSPSVQRTSGFQMDADHINRVVQRGFGVRPKPVTVQRTTPSAVSSLSNDKLGRIPQWGRLKPTVEFKSPQFNPDLDVATGLESMLKGVSLGEETQYYGQTGRSWIRLVVLTGVGVLLAMTWCFYMT